MRLIDLYFLLIVVSLGCEQELNELPDIANGSVDNTFVCVLPEIMPQFPGGLTSLKTFIKENLEYPSGSECYEGTVFVGFVVNEHGSLTDINVVKGVCDLCDKNSIEICRKMPRWIPGEMNNIPVKTKMILPIRFNP